MSQKDFYLKNSPAKNNFSKNSEENFFKKSNFLSFEEKNPLKFVFCRNTNHIKNTWSIMQRVY